MSENSYNFEEFTSYGSKFSPKISLGVTGGFGFSSGFYNRFNVKGAESLKIFYDKEKMAVAFKFLNTAESDAIKLKNRVSDAGAYIPARSFLGKYGIDPKKYANRYDPKEVEDKNLGKIYVIELKEKDE